MVPQPRAKVFAFFADAATLESLTPPSLRFTISTPLPIHMRAGAVIDYRLHLFGWPLHWRTLIESFEPETRFVDVQTQGPYALWRHLHVFEDVPASEQGPGGTLVLDRVEYALPLGPLGALVHRIFVARQLRAIFDFRHQAMERLLAPDRV